MTYNYDFTVQDVADEMRAIAAQSPNFVYRAQDPSIQEEDQCSYLGMSRDRHNEGRPCIVGQALQNLGVTRDHLDDVEGRSAFIALTWLLGLNNSHTVTADRTLNKIGLVQAHQDNGASWGEAIKGLDNVVN